MSLKSVRALPRRSPGIDGTIIGWITGYDDERGLLVDFPNNRGEPVQARTTLMLDRAQVERAIAQQQGAVLFFEQGDPRAPILVGLLQPAKLVEAQVQLPAQASPDAMPDAMVDGRRVVLTGQDEIVLRCGQASITLRKNGAVVIRGAHVVSHSSGMNRIRGGAVHIN